MKQMFWGIRLLCISVVVLMKRSVAMQKGLPVHGVFSYYHPQSEYGFGFTSMSNCEAEPMPDYETQLSQLKDQQNNSDQRLVNLERLVTDLDYEAHLTMMKEQVDESAQKMQNLEKIVSDLKKPCFRLGSDLKKPCFTQFGIWIVLLQR